MTIPATYKFNGVGCNNCWENECSHLAVASFDVNGHILKPSGGITEGMGDYYENSAPPSRLHSIPCGFNVTITGCDSYTWNESWCRDCENLNGIYYSRNYGMYNGTQTNFGGSYIDSLLPNIFKIADFPLCTPNQLTSVCGIRNIAVYLMVGPEEGRQNNNGILGLWNDNYFPSGVFNSRVYKYYDPNQSPYIPPRHLYGIAHLEYNNEDGVGIEECCGERDGFWFKTDLGEWKGDYQLTSINGYRWITGVDPGAEIYPYSECSDKYYHGDFDGRSLSFSINGSDIWEPGASARYASDDRITYTARLCNFDQMTINVAPTESTYIENITYNDGNYHTTTYPSGEIQYNTDICYIESFGSYFKSYGTEWSFNSLFTTPVGYGLLPQVIRCTIGGVVSSNSQSPTSSSMTIHTCNNCEILNTEHILEYGLNSTWYKKFNPKDSNLNSNSADRTICCNCSEDICINAIEVQIEHTNDDVFISAKVKGENGKLAEYRYHFNQENIPDTKFSGSIELFLYEYSTEWQSVCNFSNSTMTVHFNSNPDRFDCAAPIYFCTYCKSSAPEYIGVSIPGDYSVVDRGVWCHCHDVGTPEGGDYVLERSCEDDVFGDTIVGACNWTYRNPSDSECDVDGLIKIGIFSNFGPGNSIGIGVNDDGWLMGPVSWDNAICIYLGIYLGYCDGILWFGTGFSINDWGTKIRCLDGEWQEWIYNTNEDGCRNKKSYNIEHIMGGVYIDCNLLDNLELPYLGYTRPWDCHFPTPDPCYPWVTWGGSSVTLSLS